MATTSDSTCASRQVSNKGQLTPDTATANNAIIAPSLTEQRLRSFAATQAADTRIFRRALATAVVFHLGLLAVTFPSFTSDPPTPAESAKVYVVEPVRFKSPPPDEQPTIPKPKARKMPWPDPTPLDPEPVTEIVAESFDDLPVDTLDIEIPEAPPEPDVGPRFVTADVVKPVKLVYPAPRYTEIARKVRLEGLVVIQSTIDEQGNVVDATVLKGLQMGLSEAAIDAVLQWKFKPATLNGKPISVYFNLTVAFSLS